MSNEAQVSPADDSGPAPATGTQAISAIRWTLFGSVLQRLFTFAAVAVLARLLTETEYGAYRQLLAVHLVIFVLLPLGFDQLYIRELHRRDHFAKLLAAALAASAVAGAAILLVGHRQVSKAMDFGPWSNLLWLAPVVLLLQAWKLFYKTDLAARLDYRRISLGEALYACISGGVAVALALVWPAAWSLYVAYALAEVAELLWLRAGNTVALPSLISSLAHFKRDAWNWRRFGLFHCGTQVLNAIGGNAPVIIFGSALSKASAAAFSMANYLVTVPIFILIGALHRVAYSALAGRSREQLTSAVLQMLSLAAAFIVPVLVWVAAMAGPLVHVALGESWVAGTAPVAQWVAVYCIFVAIFSPVSSLDLLLDRPDYGFAWNIGATLLRIIAVVAGLKYGVMHAVAAYAIVSAALWLIWGIMLGHLLGCGQRKFHLAWLKIAPAWLLLAALEWGVLYLTGEFDTPVMKNPVIVLMLSLLPAAVYTAAVAVTMPDTFRLGLRIVRRERLPQPAGEAQNEA